MKNTFVSDVRVYRCKTGVCVLSFEEVRDQTEISARCVSAKMTLFSVLKVECLYACVCVQTRKKRVPEKLLFLSHELLRMHRFTFQYTLLLYCSQRFTVIIFLQY